MMYDPGISLKLTYNIMKKFALALAAAALGLLASCQQTPDLYRDRHLTKPISLDRDDVTLVVGRAKGSSMGCRLLGILPLWLPSESDAIDGMYEYCRKIGEAPEGKARTFANTNIERRSNYFILFSFPSVRATGDLVEFTGKGDSDDKQQQQQQQTSVININNNNN